MNRGFVSCTHEPGNVAACERRALFDGFEIGRRRVFLRVGNWLSNVHFVDHGFSRKTAGKSSEDRMGTGSRDRSRRRKQGSGGVGLAQKVEPGCKTFGKGTKERWLRS